MSSRRSIRLLVAAFVALVTACVLTACGDGSTATAQADIVGVHWVLDTAALVRGADGIVVTAEFADGQVTGDSGCNRYSASYTASPATGAMEIGPVAGTRIACTGDANRVESAYLAALGDVRRYRATGGSLRLLDDDGNVLLRYSATDQAQSLLGDWQATSYFTGTAVSSPVVDSSLTLKFERTQANGDSGCNTFSGPYTVDGDAIAIGPLAATKRACADPAIEAQEGQYLQALALATRFAVANDRLDLFRADGGIAASFQRVAQ